MRFIPLGVLALLPTCLTGAVLAQGTTNTYTTVNPYTGTVAQTRVTRPTSPGIGGIIANQNIYGSSYPGTTTNTTVTYGPRHGGHYYGHYPNQGYPVHPHYPATVHNYPGQAYSGAVSPPHFAWERPAWITNIPLGGSTTTYHGATHYGPHYGGIGHLCPVYTCRPTTQYVPVPVPVYPAPVYSYPGYVVPQGYGTYSSQTNNSGYGIRVGNGGVSVNLGQNSSTTTTTTTPLGGTGSVSVYSQSNQSGR